MEELYDLKWNLADFIKPRLQNYIEFYKYNNYENSPTVPDTWDTEDIPSQYKDKQLSFKDNVKIWVEILEKMVFSFYKDNPEDFYKDYTMDEIRIRTKEGFKLFAKYYDYLSV